MPQPSSLPFSPLLSHLNLDKHPFQVTAYPLSNKVCRGIIPYPRCSDQITSDELYCPSPYPCKTPWGTAWCYAARVLWCPSAAHDSRLQPTAKKDEDDKRKRCPSFRSFVRCRVAMYTGSDQDHRSCCHALRVCMHLHISLPRGRQGNQESGSSEKRKRKRER
ncbi:hypothetical protein K491DRAFT_348950 [Lophiostoma macrostomum CBS 122681]|uniref:Uncharacterized protein n=1 Tax=Lophiostoma macrostomum CBS 122681 TaxID=1314788 RepID=A0A6A6TDJ8_9PLEO|nr:hypothetical protein K491DRAFT_348950 [Lophiostoma macrostomum CBS 122681]